MYPPLPSPAPIRVTQSTSPFPSKAISCSFGPSLLWGTSKDVTTLRESLGSGDLEVARRIGHTLKGVGASYGFPAITVFGQKIERAVLDGRLKEAREQINQLAAYLDGVVVHAAAPSPSSRAAPSGASSGAGRGASTS